MRRPVVSQKGPDTRASDPGDGSGARPTAKLPASPEGIPRGAAPTLTLRPLQVLQPSRDFRWGLREVFLPSSRGGDLAAAASGGVCDDVGCISRCHRIRSCPHGPGSHRVGGGDMRPTAGAAAVSRTCLQVGAFLAARGRINDAGCDRTVRAFVSQGRSARHQSQRPERIQQRRLPEMRTASSTCQMMTFACQGGSSCGITKKKKMVPLKGRVSIYTLYSRAAAGTLRPCTLSSVNRYPPTALRHTEIHNCDDATVQNSISSTRHAHQSMHSQAAPSVPCSINPRTSFHP